MEPDGVGDTTMTAPEVSDTQIWKLMCEARDAGDYYMARLCESALDGDDEARQMCAWAIDDAPAND